MRFRKVSPLRTWLTRLAIGLAVVGVLALGIGLVARFVVPPKETLHLAIGGDVSDNFGLGIVKGAQLYAHQVNAQGGIDGREVVIGLSNRYRTGENGAERAREIVAENQALGVIGHTYSSGALAAGPIYAQNGIPVIAPSATNVNVTHGNDWYFRTVFNDQVQGNLLGTYTAKILEASEVAIIAHDEPYGDYLARIFRQSAWTLGTKIAYDERIVSDGADKEQQVEALVEKFQADNYRGFIFLATDLDEAILLVQKLRDREMSNPIIGADLIASNKFLRGFDHLPNERAEPGYYTNFIYVTTPVLFRTGDDALQKFLADYRARYGEEPDWQAAFAYDAAMMLGEAARITEATGQPDQLAQERQQIRDYLASLRQPKQAIRGVTGLNYFDEHGDMIKPPGIGIIENRQIVPALNQVRLVTSEEEAAGLEFATGADFVVREAERFVYRTDVVYTGMKLNQVDDIDSERHTALLDFVLWFRFVGDFEPADIIFTNAAEPIELGAPINQEDTELVNYRAYRVRGHFKTDFLNDYHTYKQHLLGVQLRHRKLSEEVLIYVPDTLGMQITPETPFTDQVAASQAFSPTLAWRVDRAWVFHDTETQDAYGHPGYLYGEEPSINFSRINMALLMVQDDLSLTSLLAGFDNNLLKVVLVPLAISLVGLVAIDMLMRPRGFAIPIWVFLVVLALLILAMVQVVAIEYVAVYLRQVDGGNAILRLVLTIFEIFWWVLPATLIYITLKRFVWAPLERQTGQPVPRILVRMVDFLLVGGTLLGILAFVFDQSVGHLLAASGVITLVIGLALQVNISNFFSGIALNMERPLRVGDWVRVSGHEEGRVIDMNWRSTRIRTRGNIVISLPNGLVAAADVQNFNLNKYISLTASIYVKPSYSPDVVLVTLHQAVSEIAGVLRRPSPRVYLATIDDVGALYTAQYAIKDYGEKADIANAVWQNIWYALQRSGISLIAGGPAAPALPAPSGGRQPAPRLISSTVTEEPEEDESQPDRVVDVSPDEVIDESANGRAHTRRVTGQSGNGRHSNGSFVLLRSRKRRKLLGIF